MYLLYLLYYITLQYIILYYFILCYTQLYVFFIEAFIFKFPHKILNNGDLYCVKEETIARNLVSLKFISITCWTIIIIDCWIDNLKCKNNYMLINKWERLDELRSLKYVTWNQSTYSHTDLQTCKGRSLNMKIVKVNSFVLYCSKGDDFIAQDITVIIGVVPRSKLL